MSKTKKKNQGDKCTLLLCFLYIFFGEYLINNKSNIVADDVTGDKDIDYLLSLSPIVRDRYINKIAELKGYDPYSLGEKYFNINLHQLPALEIMDIFLYVTTTHSYYSKEQLKAFKALEAYKYYSAQFVVQLKCAKIEDRYLVIGDVSLKSIVKMLIQIYKYIHLVSKFF